MKIAARMSDNGQFLELAGFIWDEDAVSFLVTDRALADDGKTEVLLKSDRWQSLTTTEVFAFGEEMGDEGLIL